MLTKIKIGLAFFVLAGLIGTGVWMIQTDGNNNESEIRYIASDFLVDVTDDRVLAGAAHNIFIGKVIAQTGTKTDRHPMTQFSVEVIENIKGNFTGTITVNQEGGYENIDGKNYLFLMEGDKLIKPGKTYLFATRVNDAEGWHTLVPVYGDIPIEDQNDQKDKKERFKKAFEQEIPLEEQIQKQRS